MIEARTPVVLTAAAVVAATRGRLVAGSPETVFDGVSIDSRAVKRGQLFVALRGPRFDGTMFVASSFAAGAAGAVVPAGWSARAEEGRAVIETADTLNGLQRLGHAVRQASGARVVAITGSAGKTTTKEVAAEFLRERYTVYRNPGNLNNHIGLPLSLVDLRQRPEIAVVELGMNHAGEIRQLVALAAPDVRVWTNVGDAHLGFFASAEGIADAKAEILEGAGARDVLVANADDPRVAARASRFAGRLVTFGTSPGADVRACEVVDRGIDGTAAQVIAGGEQAEFRVPLIGRGNLSNVLAAAAVALQFDVPLAAIAERAARLQAAPRRGEVVRLREGVTLVDDSYNASPAAVRATLATLAQEPRRRVVVLGEMLELGEFALDLHASVGRAVAECGASVLVTVGGTPAAALAAAAAEAGVPAEAVHHLASSTEAAEVVAALLTAGDVVLVKGSRGIRTDVVADRIRQEWA